MGAIKAAKGVDGGQQMTRIFCRPALLVRRKTALSQDYDRVGGADNEACIKGDWML